MLEKILKEYNLSKDKIEKLNTLRDICLEYNNHTNITSITNEEEFNIKHIIDSLEITKHFKLNNKKICDVGSGAGFPGLVLAIILDDSEITMIDSNGKKTKYIEYASKILNLKNVLIINSRSEEINLKFDVAISRAVAPLNILLEITHHLPKENGLLIMYKGANLIKEMPKNIKVIEEKLFIKFDKKIEYILEDEIKRNLISFKKIKEFKEVKLRSYSQIKSNPLY